MLCSPLGPSSWKPWPSLGLHRARPADQRFNLPHPSFPTQAPKTQNENWCLTNIELAWRDQLGISFQAIGAVETHPPALQAFEEPLQGSSVTTAQLPVEEPSRSAIPSRPDPVLAGPFLRECHMSSSSTTTARPSGLGFWA